MSDEPEPWRGHTDGTMLTPLEVEDDDTPAAASWTTQPRATTGAADPLPTRVASPWPSQQRATDTPVEVTDDEDKVESVFDLIDVAARAAAAERDADALWGSPTEDTAAVWDRARTRGATAAVWDDDAGVDFSGWDTPSVPAGADPARRDPSAAAAADGMPDHPDDDEPETFTFAVSGGGATPGATPEDDTVDDEPETFRFAADADAPAPDQRTVASSGDDEPTTFTYDVGGSTTTGASDDGPTLADTARPRPDTGWTDLDAQETSTWGGTPPLPVRRPGATAQPEDELGLGDLFSGDAAAALDPALSEPVEFDLFADPEPDPTPAAPTEDGSDATADDEAEDADDEAPPLARREPAAIGDDDPVTAGDHEEPSVDEDDDAPWTASTAVPVTAAVDDLADASPPTGGANPDEQTPATDAVWDDDDQTAEPDGPLDWDRAATAGPSAASVWDAVGDGADGDPLDWGELIDATDAGDPAVWGGDGLAEDEDDSAAVWHLTTGDGEEDDQAVWAADAGDEVETVVAASPGPTAPPALPRREDAPPTSTPTPDAATELAAALGDVLDAGPQGAGDDRASSPPVPGTPQAPTTGFGGLDGFDEMDDVLASAQRAADEAALDTDHGADAAPSPFAPGGASAMPAAPPPAAADRLDGPAATPHTPTGAAPESAAAPAADPPAAAPAVATPAEPTVPAPTPAGTVAFSSGGATPKEKKRRKKRFWER